MTRLDPSQRRVLDLDPSRHARVLGAPGSGKTLLLTEVYRRLLGRPGWGEADLLVLAPSRLVAAQLRRRIESRHAAPLSGAPARTAVSYAFAVLRRAAAVDGRTPPRLLTGTAHDEAVAGVLREWGERGDPLPFAPEVVGSAPFRAELRELTRVLDDFALRPDELRQRLGTAAAGSGADVHTLAPAPGFLEGWEVALELLGEVEQRLARERPDELSSSALLGAACRVLLADPAIPVPRLVLVDDAQEVGEGQLALLAALARRGAGVWVFGDPDIATGAFQGERVRLLSGVEPELRRRGAEPPPRRPRDGESGEQLVVLERVHRHGAELRSFVREVTERIGAAGAGAQRGAHSSDPAAADPGAEDPWERGPGAEDPGERGPGAATAPAVEFATVRSTAEQLGVVAHRLRRRRLGLDGGGPVEWRDMAVVCRSRVEVARAARVLAGHQVPTSVAAGGVVLREHQLVRELIRLLQHALDIAPIGPEEVGALLGGYVGGLDPIALRRLRGALRLQEIREARQQGRDPVATDRLLAEGFEAPGDTPLIDSRGGRRLRRLGRLAAAGAKVRERGGTPRETLWAIWEGAGLAERLRETALSGRGARADEAHRMLDAVMALFFALQRHEEQASAQPVAELLDELLASTVPEDSLATRCERNVVTVTTPQGVIGREFSVVCLLGLQDGAWPNLRARGFLLGVTALERWLRGEPAAAPSRRDTLHDELRLYAQACSRAREEILVVAIADEDHHPSSFFSLGRAHEVEDPLPSTRLTLRGAVAEMRRRLALDPADAEALASLAALARAGAPGAHPDEWYGVLPPSTSEPLVDLRDPERTVRVSPSQIESAERCPLDWAISTLGGGGPQLAADIGTLLHAALETAARTGDGETPSAEELMRIVEAEWGALAFDANWQEEQQRGFARAMVDGIVDYLRSFRDSGGELLGTEVRFSLRIGQAVLSGSADRLEARTDGSGERRVSVVDLKTGKRLPPKAERESHAQLQAYQLGVNEGAFEAVLDAALGVEPGLEPGAEPGSAARSGGARLLYVHPKALGKNGARYAEAEQAALSPEAEEMFRARVAAVAEVMAAGAFAANVEHHCEDDYALGTSCRIHIVPAVSHA